MNFYKPSVGISHNIKLIIKIFFIVLVFAYLVFHAISGQNGFISYVKIKKQLDTKSKTLFDLNKHFNFIQKRVYLLSNNTLDLDLLEERARVVLNYSYPEDIIVREKQIYENSKNNF